MADFGTSWRKQWSDQRKEAHARSAAGEGFDPFEGDAFLPTGEFTMGRDMPSGTQGRDPQQENPTFVRPVSWVEAQAYDERRRVVSGHQIADPQTFKDYTASELKSSFIKAGGAEHMGISRTEAWKLNRGEVEKQTAKFHAAWVPTLDQQTQSFSATQLPDFQVSTGEVEARRQKLGLPSLSPTGLPENARTKAHTRLFQTGAEMGKTRTETYQAVQEGMQQGALGGEWNKRVDPQDRQNTTTYGQQYLQEKFLGPNYQSHVESTQSAASPFGFVSKAQWQQMPQHLQARLADMRLPKKDDYHQVIPEEGRFSRGGEYTFPTSAITDASFLGRTPDGRVITTWGEGKSEKRVQTLGAHKTLQVNTLPSSPELIKEGPASQRPETLRQNMRGALILGGDVGGPGAGLFDFGAGARAQERVYRSLAPSPTGATVPVERGAVFSPGSEMALAAGATGENTGKWRYQVEDVFEQEDGGYSFVLQRSAAINQARIAFKDASTKAQGIGTDLSGVTDVQGKPLDLQFMAARKDLQGAVFSRYAGLGTSALAQDIHSYLSTDTMKQAMSNKGAYAGYNLPSQITPESINQYVHGRSWSELGSLPVRAYSATRLQDDLQEIRYPQIMTRENMEKFREGGSIHGTPEDVGGGRVRATVRYQAIVGELGKLISEENPFKRPFLSAEEMESVKRANPEEYERLYAAGTPTRERYQEVMNAALATSGEREMPGNFRDVGRNEASALHATASAAANKGLPEGATASRGRVARSLIDMMAAGEQGTTPMVLGTGTDPLYLPSPKTLQAMGASSEWEGSEETRVLRMAAEAFSAFGSGDKGEFDRLLEDRTVRDEEGNEEVIKGLRSELGDLASGGEFRRRTMGTALDRKTAHGDVMHMSLALKPGEAYIPQLGDPGSKRNRIAQVLRFPSQMTDAHDPAAGTILKSRDEARKLGLNLSVAQFSPEDLVRIAADADGDKFLAYIRGDATVNKQGELVTNDGAVLGQFDTIKNHAFKRLNEGAASAMGDMAGTIDNTKNPFMTTEQAKTQWQKEVGEMRALSPQQLSQDYESLAFLRNKIGQLYLPFRAAAGQIAPQAMEAFETMWLASHGRAQRPEKQIPGMERFHTVLKTALVKDPKKWTPGQTDAQRRLGGGNNPMIAEKGKSFVPFKSGGTGVKGAFTEAAQALGYMKGDEGEMLIGGEGMGTLFGGTPEAVASIGEAATAYQAATPGTPESMALETKMTQAVLAQGQEAMFDAPIGQMIMPKATEAGLNKMLGAGLGLSEMAQTLGVPEPLLQEQLNRRESQKARLQVYGRKNVMASKAADMMESLGAGWLGKKIRPSIQSSIDQDSNAVPSTVEGFAEEKLGDSVFLAPSEKMAALWARRLGPERGCSPEDMDALQAEYDPADLKKMPYETNTQIAVSKTGRVTGPHSLSGIGGQAEDDFGLGDMKKNASRPSVSREAARAQAEASQQTIQGAAPSREQSMRDFASARVEKLFAGRSAKEVAQEAQDVKFGKNQVSPVRGAYLDFMSDMPVADRPLAQEAWKTALGAAGIPTKEGDDGALVHDYQSVVGSTFSERQQVNQAARANAAPTESDVPLWDPSSEMGPRPGDTRDYGLGETPVMGRHERNRLRSDAARSDAEAGIPVMMTANMRSQLSLLGFTPTQVKNMTPKQAWQNINNAAAGTAASSAGRRQTPSTPPPSPGGGSTGSTGGGGGGGGPGGPTGGGGGGPGGGGGGPGSSGAGRVGIVTQAHIDKLNRMNAQLDTWHGTVGKAIASGETLDKEQIKVAKNMGGMAENVARLPSQVAPARGVDLQEYLAERAEYDARGGPDALKGAKAYAEKEDLNRQMLRAQGIDPDAPEAPAKDSTSMRVAKGLRGLTSGWEMMRMRRMWGMTGGPVFDQMIPAAAEAGMAEYGASTAIGGYQPGEAPGGVTGGLMRYQADQRQSMIDAGRTGYQVWGAGPLGGVQNAMRGAQAVMGPAAGAGLIAGGLASTLGIGGGGLAGMATVGLPVTAILAAAGGTYAAGRYSWTRSEDTSENSLRGMNLQRQSTDRSNNWRSRISAGIAEMPDFAGAVMRNEASIFGLGADVGVNERPSIKQWRAERAAQGAALSETEFGDLDSGARGASLSWAAGELRKQGGAFANYDEGQIMQMFQQAAGQMPEFSGMTGAGLAAAPPRELDIMATTGRSYESYEQLSSQLRLGPTGSRDLLNEFGYADDAKAREYEYKLSKWAELTSIMPLERRQEMVRSAASPYENQEEYDAASGRISDVLGSKWPDTSGAAELPGIAGVLGGLLPQPGSTAQEALTGFAGNILAGPPPLASLSLRGQNRLPSVVGQIRELQTQGNLPIDYVPRQADITEEWLDFELERTPAYAAVGRATNQGFSMGLGMEASARGARAAGAAGGKVGTDAYTGLLAGDPRMVDAFAAATSGMETQGGIPVQQMKDGMVAGLQQVLPPELFESMMETMEGILPALEESGHAMGTTQMPEGWAEGLSPIGVGDARWSTAVDTATTRGRRGLQEDQIAVTTAYQDFQMKAQQDSINLQSAAQFGGVMQNPYSGESMETRGSFEIVKELRGLGRQWEDFSSDYGEKQRELSGRQFMENWQVRMGRLPQQFERQREDVAFQGAQQSIQFGWQMEDTQEQLRFATGRDRRRLLRQQERSTIMFGMNQGQLDTQGQRIDQNEEQANEDMERSRRHFEERQELQDSYQSQYRSYIEERRRLEDELQGIQEFQARFNIDAANTQLAKQREMQAELRAINEAYRLMNVTLENSSVKGQSIANMFAHVVTQVEEGGPLQAAFDDMFSDIQDSLDNIVVPSLSVR